MVVGAVQRDGKVRLRVKGGPDAKNLRGFVKEVVDGDAEAIYTDEAQGYGDLNDWNTRA